MAEYEIKDGVGIISEGTKVIKDYQKDYLDKYAEFEKAKSMFIHDLEIDKLNNVKWELDYNSRILTVTYEEKT